MAKKVYEKCDRCDKKGVYLSNGYPYWGDGTKVCRYCGKTWPGLHKLLRLEHPKVS